MNPLLRFVPALVAVVLVVIKMANPDFLGTAVFPDVKLLAWLTWYWAVFLPVAWLAAWLMTPPFMAMMNALAKQWFIPLTLFLILALGIIALLEALWSMTFASWFGWPEWTLLDRFTSATIGGH